MSRISLIIFVQLLFCFSFAKEPVLADSIGNYYGSVGSTGQSLKKELHDILNSAHISEPGRADRLVNGCDSLDMNCYKHTSLGYKTARKHLFGDIHLEENEDGEYTIQTAYCRDFVTDNDFPGSGNGNIGPMKIPNSNIINAEHSWPQSRFTSKFSKGLQKADLHHLFPTHSKVNSIRGNFPFGEVENVKNAPCDGGVLGSDNDSSRKQFEPDDETKGNIARALFYFSTRYDTKIDDTQEAYLRLWNILDPVDDFERLRNEKIYSLQYIRNPFIDKPELIDEIKDF